MGRATRGWRAAHKDFIFWWAGRDRRDHREGGLRAGQLACAKPLGQRASRPLRGPPMGRQCNAQDARCPSEPIPCAKRQAGAIPVVSVVPAVPVAGARARSGQVPAWPTARRQDGGVPSQAYARSIDWDSRLPGGGMGNACAVDPTTVKRPKQPEGQHRSRRRSAMSCCQNKGRYR